MLRQRKRKIRGPTHIIRSQGLIRGPRGVKGEPGIPGSNENLYNTSDILDGDRVVDSNNFDMHFDNTTNPANFLIGNSTNIGLTMAPVNFQGSGNPGIGLSRYQSSDDSYAFITMSDQSGTGHESVQGYTTSTGTKQNVAQGNKDIFSIESTDNVLGVSESIVQESSIPNVYAGNGQTTITSNALTLTKSLVENPDEDHVMVRNSVTGSVEYRLYSITEMFRTFNTQTISFAGAATGLVHFGSAFTKSGIAYDGAGTFNVPAGKWKISANVGVRRTVAGAGADNDLVMRFQQTSPAAIIYSSKIKTYPVDVYEITTMLILIELNAAADIVLEFVIPAADSVLDISGINEDALIIFERC